jgi:hypothetical protein
MKTTPDLIAKLIFSSSQLRYFELELFSDPRNFELQDIVWKWQAKLDQVLYEMGMTDFVPLKQLIEILKLSDATEANTTQTSERLENA